MKTTPGRLFALGMFMVLVPGIFNACADSGTPTPAASPADPARAKRAKEFWNLGNAYEEKGLTEKARQYWAIARDLDPSVSDAAPSPSSAATPGSQGLPNPAFQAPVFVADPGRPYNAMVKNLYDQALESYSRGDTAQTLDLLQRAADLDPLQPQVASFLGEIQAPPEKPAGPLDKVRQALEKGNSEEALAKLEDYLDEHPDDEEALELKDKIEGKRHSPKAGKKQPSKSAKALVAMTPTAVSDQDQQAQADQAYNLGLESYRQGDYAAAKKFWAETLDIQPTHLQARRNLDRLLEEHPELK